MAQRLVASARAALADAEGKARRRIIQKVARARSMEVAPFLAAVLTGDPDAESRALAAGGLLSLGDSSVVEPLIAGLDDRDAKVRARVAKCLQRLTRQKYGEQKMLWLDWWARAREFFRTRG